MESESIAGGFLIVKVEHVNASAIDVLPFRDGLFDPLCLWDFAPEELEESGFATANVTLNSIVKVTTGEFRVHGVVLLILI